MPKNAPNRETSDNVDMIKDDLGKCVSNFCTCDTCKDQANCQYAGFDPFNMNGECLAIK